MQFILFHPNKSSQGSAIQFNYNEKDNNTYVSITKQTGWNDESKTGSFKDGEKHTTKLAIVELAQILRAIATKGECSFYHKTSSPSQIFFSLYKTKDEEGKEIAKGYVFRVVKKDGEDKITFSCGISFDELYILKAFLEEAIKNNLYFQNAPQEQKKEEPKKELAKPKQEANDDDNVAF